MPPSAPRLGPAILFAILVGVAGEPGAWGRAESAALGVEAAALPSPVELSPSSAGLPLLPPPSSLPLLPSPGGLSLRPPPPEPITAPPPEPVPTVEERLAAGRRLLKAHQPTAAIAELLPAVAEAERLAGDPSERSMVYFVLGMALRAGGRSVEAIAALERAVALSPEDAVTRLELGLLLLSVRRFDEARAAAEAALELGLSDAEDRAAARSLAALAEVRSLLFAGKQLLKAKASAAAIDKLGLAVSRAQQLELSSDEQAATHYALGLALSIAGREAQALMSLQQALRLSPHDSECRLERAQLLFRQEQFAEAGREARAALADGLSDPADQQEARALVAQAKREQLRERFNADLVLSFGYDSNVLESAIFSSVGGQCASGCSQLLQKSAAGKLTAVDLQTQLRDQAALVRRLSSDYSGGIVDSYLSPRPPQQEWDLPSSLQAELRGRLLSRSGVELWAGYRFYQYLLPSVAFDHDAYSLQEHTLPLFLIWQARSWLRLRVRLEGYVNFSGLKQMLPFQGGLRTAFETTLIESPRLRTRLLYFHQYRRSFDRVLDGYLDGNLDELRLIQELRLGTQPPSLRLQLGWRLRSEQTGTFSDLRDFQPGFLYRLPAAGAQPTVMPVTLGTFDYAAPLGYIGSEVASRARLYLPHRLEAAAGLAYEYRRYDGLYSATYSSQWALVPLDPGSCTYLPTGRARTVPCPGDGPDPTGGSGGVPLPSGSPQPSTVALPGRQRIDSLLSLEGSLLGHLGRGLSVELAYLYQHNFSNIANLIDNRSYDKHQVTASLLYSF